MTEKEQKLIAYSGFYVAMGLPMTWLQQFLRHKLQAIHFSLIRFDDELRIRCKLVLVKPPFVTKISPQFM